MGDKVKGYRCVHHPQILTAYYKCKLHIGQCIAIDIVDLGHMDLVPPPTLILWHRSLAIYYYCHGSISCYRPYKHCMALLLTGVYYITVCTI